MRKISTIRASRFDSELISCAICLRFSSVSAYREISSLDPWIADSGVRISCVTKCIACWYRARSASLRFRLLRRHQVIIRRRRDASHPRRRDRGRERKHPPVREREYGAADAPTTSSAPTTYARHARQIPEAAPAAATSANANTATQNSGTSVIYSPCAIVSNASALISTPLFGTPFRVRSEEAIVLGLRRDSREDDLAREQRRLGGIGQQILQRKRVAIDDPEAGSGRGSAAPGPTAGMRRAADLQIVAAVRFEDLRIAAQPKSLERDRPPPVCPFDAPREGNAAHDRIVVRRDMHVPNRRRRRAECRQRILPRLSSGSS